MGITLLLDT